MKQYTIFFLGESINDLPLDELKKNLALMFKCDLARIEKLFTGGPVAIKKDLSAEKTKAYQQALIKAGAKIVIKENISEADKPANQAAVTSPNPTQSTQASTKQTSGLNAGLAGLINYNADVGSTPSNTAPPTPVESPISKAEASTKSEVQETTDDTDEGLSLAPPNSGSLEEFAEHKKPVDLPDISQLSMSEANKGSLEEFAEHKEPAELPDISNLSMSEANAGDLRDFALSQPAVELPDISFLELDDGEQEPEDEEEIEFTVATDTSHLTMSEANSGSLEEFNQRPEPVKIPDVSHIKVV